MLTPEYLNSCTDYLLGMYDALNQSIAEDIARRIVKTGQMTDSAKWQVKQLRENGELIGSEKILQCPPELLIVLDDQNEISCIFHKNLPV